MSASPLDITTSQNFSAAQVGPLEELDRYQFFHPLGKGRGFPGKLFLKDPLGMSGMEVSLNKLPPGQAVPFYHQHKTHEELYLFLKGRGQFQVDGQVIEVREGTAIRVAPGGVRTWRNHSTEDLYYIVIQARNSSMDASDIDDGVVCPEKVNWPA